MKIKEIIEKIVAVIKEQVEIKKCIFRKQYFGKVEGYDFRKIEPEDVEIYDMMIHQPQYMAVSEAEFLERFLLNKSKRERFLKEMVEYQDMRKTILYTITYHMQLIYEKVTRV